MYYLLYNLVGLLFFIITAPFFLLYICFTGKHRHGLTQRVGFLQTSNITKTNNLRIWLHAASVGEVQVARALAIEIKKQIPQVSLVLSTVTRQGHDVARQQMDADIPCIYAPLDLTLIVNRHIEFIKPNIYISLETELWPALIQAAYKNKIQLVLLNGRMSARSYRRYKFVKNFMEDILNKFAIISVIQENDAKRYINLGADPAKVVINGNAKYDLTPHKMEAATVSRYHKLLKIKSQQPVFIAGSTHSGEEELLLDVFNQLKTILPELIWIIAPRHLRRIDEISTFFNGQKINHEHLSKIKTAGRHTDIILIDNMGELSALYSIATYIFCGGSLVKRGGHNILEAAIWGKPVLYGPSMEDFIDARQLLETAGGGFTVKNTQELTDRIVQFIKHPEQYKEAADRARKVAQTEQGSARKQIALLKEII